MKTFDKTLAEYNYQFDTAQIATEPAEPRDSAKMLVYRKETGEEFFDTFANIGEYLPKNCVLVLNDTKVFPARLHVKKSTGGRVEVFYVGITNDELGDRTARTQSGTTPNLTTDDDGRWRRITTTPGVAPYRRKAERYPRRRRTPPATILFL